MVWVHLDIFNFHSKAEAMGQKKQKQNENDKQTRRAWTMHEEELLAQSFKKIIALGWKRPNGFRNGFLMQLEELMRKAMPGTDLQGDPHISSKYCSWNKTYRSIVQCLGNKGFTWNSSTHTLEAPSHVWDKLLKVSPKLASVRGRPFPLYNTWIEIYGKNQATGEIAIDQQPAPTTPEVEAIEHDNDQNIQETENFIHQTPVRDEEGPQSSNATPKISVGHGSDLGSKKRKTGVDPTEEELLEYISGFCASPSISIDKNQKQSIQDRKSRRSWTMHEELLLAQSFKEIMNLGWKTPNGFRTGFLVQLELRMRKAMPRTDLRSEPHISSKYGTWKRTYRTIAECLERGDFKWNSSTHTLEASSQAWDKLLKSSPRLASIRRKPFLLYNAWVEIFGKDQAVGEPIAPAPQMEPDQPIEGNRKNIEETEENSIRDPTQVPDEDGTQSCNATPKTSSGHGSGSSKRKHAGHKDGALVEVVSRVSSSMEKLASLIGSEIDASRLRGELYGAIGRLNMCITMDDHLKVAYMLAMNPKAMDMFFGLPEEAKVGMVRMVIEGKLK